MGQKKKRYTRPTTDELQQFRAFLGPVASKYNAQLAQLYWEMHEMARLLLDIYDTRQENPSEED